MKKLFIISLIPLMLLCGCKKEQQPTTKTILDTTYSITAECDEKVFDGAFLLGEKYEKLLSQNYPDSEISMINSHDTMELSAETIEILKLALKYCELTGGKYDITLEPVINLYDFENQVYPTVKDIKSVSFKVGFNRIEINENLVDLHNTDVNLSSARSGYITDKMVKYLKENNVEKAVVGFDNAVSVFGQKYNFVIKKPQSNKTRLTIKIKDTCAVTTGIYDKFFEKDGLVYHHILNSANGYPVENNLASVTVVGKNTAECQVLSYVCLILGEESAPAFINQISDYEAIFINKDNSVFVTDGLKIKGKKIVYK